MRAPNHKFANTILQYKDKCAGPRLTLQNIFMFLFLGNRVREVSLLVRREDDKWNADITPLQLKIVRRSQWILT